MRTKYQSAVKILSFVFITLILFLPFRTVSAATQMTCARFFTQMPMAGAKKIKVILARKLLDIIMNIHPSEFLNGNAPVLASLILAQLKIDAVEIVKANEEANTTEEINQASEQTTQLLAVLAAAKNNADARDAKILEEYKVRIEGLKTIALRNQASEILGFRIPHYLYMHLELIAEKKKVSIEKVLEKWIQVRSLLKSYHHIQLDDLTMMYFLTLVATSSNNVRGVVTEYVRAQNRMHISFTNMPEGLRITIFLSYMCEKFNFDIVTMYDVYKNLQTYIQKEEKLHLLELKTAAEK